MDNILDKIQVHTSNINISTCIFLNKSDLLEIDFHNNMFWKKHQYYYESKFLKNSLIWFKLKILRLDENNIHKIIENPDNNSIESFFEINNKEPLEITKLRLDTNLKYEKIMRKNFFQTGNFHVKDCGMIVNSSNSMISFTPNNIINEEFFLQIKSCIELPENLEKNIPSDHYLQIQLGLYISKMKGCYYILYSLLNIRNVFAEIIFPDVEYWKNTIEPIISIYHSKYLKNINLKKSYKNR